MIGEEKYKQLEKDILKILIPVPEQRKPTTWAFATSRRTIGEIMKVVKQFITERNEEETKAVS